MVSRDEFVSAMREVKDDLVKAVWSAPQAQRVVPPLQLVHNTDDGTIYAYGPGQFRKLNNMDELKYGRDIGLYTQADWRDTDSGGIEVYRGLSLEGAAKA